MLSNEQLEKLKIYQTKINHLFYAMTFFIKKFDETEINVIFFKIFFSNSIDKKLFQLSSNKYQDPPFYSFEYRNHEVIGNSERNFQILKIFKLDVSFTSFVTRFFLETH